MSSMKGGRAVGVRFPVRSEFTWEPGTWVIEEDHDLDRAIIKGVVADVS